MAGFSRLLLSLLFALELASSQKNYNNNKNNRNEESAKSCKTRLGDEGRCVVFSKCAILRKRLYDEAGQVSFVLQQYSCKTREYGLHVCCPNEDDSTTETTKSSKRPAATTESTAFTSWLRSDNTKPSTATKPSWASAPDGSKTIHANRKLLPEDSCGVEIIERIVGGNYTKLGEYPWMALLKMTTPNKRTWYGCGGSLITEQYVLTAAHCIEGREQRRQNIRVIQVRLGEHNLDQLEDCEDTTCAPLPIDVSVEKITIHPGFRGDDIGRHHDIALIRLRRKVRFSLYVSPICLPLDEIASKNYTGKKLFVAGWGRTTNNFRDMGSAIKKKVAIPVLPHEKCRPFYRKSGAVLIDSQLCAGGEKSQDSCAGDSGGPLMSTNIVGSQIRWHATGIVSFGPQYCGSDKIGGIYTSVSHHLDWILDTIRD